jgi:cyclic pyranopterin phosphate synthase
VDTRESIGALPPNEEPSTVPLRDGFGRIADDLRISVTDKCNFRCTYCMPAEGLPWLSRDRILSFEEIGRLVTVFVSLGVRTVRLTGGEPLVRGDLSLLVAMIRERSVRDIAMTTNGVLLEEHANPLARAGLRRVNVSLDSLLRHRFAELTRRDMLHRVLAGVRAATEAGLSPVKLNCVVIKDVNDDEVERFAALARRTGLHVRFIEFMPLDADKTWTPDRVVPSREIIERISRVHELTPIDDGPAPARRYVFRDGSPGSIGVIPSVTEPFCGDCNRIRITADGQFRTCLFAQEETDLRALLRQGASDRDIAEVIREAVARKWAGHSIGQAGFRRPERSMSMIGG